MPKSSLCCCHPIMPSILDGEQDKDLLIQCGKRSILNPEKWVTPLVIKMLMDNFLPMQQHYFLFPGGNTWWNWPCLHEQGAMSRAVIHPQLFHGMFRDISCIGIWPDSRQTGDNRAQETEHSMAALVWGSSWNLSGMGLLGSVSKRKIMSLKNNWHFSDIFQVNFRCSSMLLLNMR